MALLEKRLGDRIVSELEDTLVTEYDCHVTDHEEDVLNRECIKHKF
jgi:hypothetical protein